MHDGLKSEMLLNDVVLELVSPPSDDVGHACSPPRFWTVTLPSASGAEDFSAVAEAENRCAHFI